MQMFMRVLSHDGSKFTLTVSKSKPVTNPHQEKSRPAATSVGGLKFS
jgi:hypothetical protein